MTDRPIYPELVTGRADAFESGRWIVKPGFALRGHASCDFLGRVLEVPLGRTTADRVIRAHELMHVRVSPHDVNPLQLYPELPPRALECAEEFRVNELLRRLRLPVAALCDGSEAVSGQRLALNGAWEEAVYFFVATIGTGAERQFLRGVRKVRPEWATALALLRRRTRQLTAGRSAAEIGETARERAGEAPRGFATVTVPLARAMATMADAAVPADPEATRQLRRALEPGGRRAPTGRFAALVLDPSLEYRTTGRGHGGRRPRPQVAGATLRYPARLLSDPHRRAFARPGRSDGGVVVVDQSGSMNLDGDDLDALLAVTPGATVIGYSHRPGDRGGRPNAWVLAARGRRATSAPSGNVGNGVDGPVLRLAARLRRGSEPFIWVTDGQVTDSNDHPCPTLAMECAELVLGQRIRLVRTVSEAAAALARRGTPEPAAGFGRVGREIGRMAV